MVEFVFVQQFIALEKVMANWPIDIAYDFRSASVELTDAGLSFLVILLDFTVEYFSVDFAKESDSLFAQVQRTHSKIETHCIIVRAYSLLDFMKDIN